MYDEQPDGDPHGECAAEIQRLTGALENCRLYAARYRNEPWASVIRRFCFEGGATGSPLRSSTSEGPVESAQVAPAAAREKFEAYFAASRRNRGRERAEHLLDRLPDGTYALESTQRHWWTWQSALAAEPVKQQEKQGSPGYPIECTACGASPVPGDCPTCMLPEPQEKQGEPTFLLNDLMKVVVEWTQACIEEAVMPGDVFAEAGPQSIAALATAAAAEEKVRSALKACLAGGTAPPRSDPVPGMVLVPAARDVLAERWRQVEKEHWMPGRDDTEHARGELAAAAACYAMNAAAINGTPPPSLSTISKLWPWAEEWLKPTTPRRDLVKAGALILAEIERLDRAAAPKALKPSPAQGEDL